MSILVCAFALTLCWFVFDSRATIPEAELPKGVSVRLEVVSVEQMQLVIRNDADQPVEFIANISLLEKDRFMDFPTAGALQFRTQEKVNLDVKYHGIGWCYPSFWSSVINQPVFGERGGKMPPAPPLDKVTMAGHESKTIPFEYGRVLKFCSHEVSAGIPAEYRIMIGIRIETEGRQSGLAVVSDWLKIP